MELNCCSHANQLVTPAGRMNGMTYDEIKDAWNAQADEHNQWDALGEDEKIEWAASIAAAKERMARQAAQVEVVNLKERIARAGVEQRRAVMEEREACARVAERVAKLTAASLGMEIQDACAAAIRARLIPGPNC